eukprot:3667487-Rhodomonas_salina.1
MEGGLGGFSVTMIKKGSSRRKPATGGTPRNCSAMACPDISHPCCPQAKWSFATMRGACKMALYSIAPGDCSALPPSPRFPAFSCNEFVRSLYCTSWVRQSRGMGLKLPLSILVPPRPTDCCQ